MGGRAVSPGEMSKRHQTSSRGLGGRVGSGDDQEGEKDSSHDERLSSRESAEYGEDEGGDDENSHGLTKGLEEPVLEDDEEEQGTEKMHGIAILIKVKELL